MTAHCSLPPCHPPFLALFRTAFPLPCNCFGILRQPCAVCKIPHVQPCYLRLPDCRPVCPESTPVAYFHISLVWSYVGFLFTGFPLLSRASHTSNDRLTQPLRPRDGNGANSRRRTVEANFSRPLPRDSHRAACRRPPTELEDAKSPLHRTHRGRSSDKTKLSHAQPGEYYDGYLMPDDTLCIGSIYCG